MKINISLRSFLLPVTIFIILLTSYAFSNSTFYPTVSIAVEKMNVLYLGVENPIVVAVAGVPSENIVVSSDDLTLTDMDNGRFIAQGSKPGKAVIKVTGDGFESQEIAFRVKRIPDPTARVLNSSGGSMSIAKMQASKGVTAQIECFDFDARCSITGFEMTHVPEQGDPVNVNNEGGGRYTKASRTVLEHIKAGDIIYFDNVKCKCPGDRASRAINSMVFKLK